jgi:hypothetical protein
MLPMWDLASWPTGRYVLSIAAVKRSSVARTSTSRGAAVLDRAVLEGNWTVVGNYLDEQLGRVVTSAAVRLDADQPRVLGMWSQGSLPLPVERYPHFSHSPRTAARSSSPRR